jgi:hypothetical protein
MFFDRGKIVVRQSLVFPNTGSTPAARASSSSLDLGGLSYTHEEISELLEKMSLERFGHKIANHIVGGTPLEG